MRRSRFSKNNLVWIIVGVNSADKRRLSELKVERRVKERYQKKLVRSRLTEAGHVKRMGDEKLSKRADAQKERGKVGDEDRNYDGMTALRETWNEWEKNGEKEQRAEGIGDCWEKT